MPHLSGRKWSDKYEEWNFNLLNEDIWIIQTSEAGHRDLQGVESLCGATDFEGGGVCVNQIYNISDCGFGFENRGYYEDMAKRNSKRLTEANNWIVFVRGNHDNPTCFDGRTFNHRRMMAVPDYTIIQACGHTILCVGGAISIDRRYRLDKWEAEQKKPFRGHHFPLDNRLAKHYYWADEMPVYDDAQLHEINEKFAIDTVITHTAPSFCELRNKNFHA